MSDNFPIDKEWNAAEHRAKVLADLPEQLTQDVVEQAIRQLDVSRATLFRWLKKFREDGRTSALLPSPRGPRRGMQPLDPDVEAIVSRLFRELYATRRKPTKTRFWREVVADCRDQGLAPPSIRRLGRWLERHDQAKLMARREGKDKAERRHLATPGTLIAERPLDIMQIDHTKADVTVVDPVTRRPLGRPTLTVAIDVNSRMVLGFHLSLELHGTDLHEVGGATLPDILGPARFDALQSYAKTGAAVLGSWARGEGQGALGPVEMLLFLTTRHRRASPPNVSEQPRMSLGARRDYHAFLTTPIIRQALTVVVPEYDRVAPVLTKPVRPGLHALVQGSLLQTFALTVGIGRVAEDPVGQVIAVLLASDAEGQERLRDVLKAWPLSWRRRISARFWRAERDERDRQIAEKATRRCQSHKLQRVQSHKYRYRIS